MKTPQVTNQNNNPVQILFTLSAKLFSFQNSFEKDNFIQLYEFNGYFLTTKTIMSLYKRKNALVQK